MGGFFLGFASRRAALKGAAVWDAMSLPKEAAMKSSKWFVHVEDMARPQMRPLPVLTVVDTLEHPHITAQAKYTPHGDSIHRGDY